MGQAHLIPHYSVNPQSNLWALLFLFCHRGRGSVNKLAFKIFSGEVTSTKWQSGHLKALVPGQRHQKSKQKLSEDLTESVTILEDSKVYSNQMKAEWRKGEWQPKNGRKALLCFYCPYPLPPSPAQWQSLKKPAPMTCPFPVAGPGVAVSLNLSGSYQRADASCSSLSQARKAPGVAGEPC